MAAAAQEAREVAREAAQQAREVAREAREVSREARAVYTHQAAKVKDVLYLSLLLLAILYAMVIVFTIEARGRHYYYDVADGGPSAPNQWVTFMGTMKSFVGYTLVHMSLVTATMIVQGRPGAPSLAQPYSWFAPIVIFCVGCSYFHTYASISSHGTHILDWIATGCFSGLLLGFTFFVIWAPMTVASIFEHLVPGVKGGEHSA